MTLRRHPILVPWLWSTLLALALADTKIQRLPRSLWPTQYTLHIRTDAQGRNFTGNVTIEIEIKEDTDNITMHSRGLQLGPPLIINQGTGKELNVSGVGNSAGSLTLQLASGVRPGDRLRLSLYFQGRLNSGRQRGYYRVRTGAQDDQWMSGTVFEYNHAREAFPCFDEPEFKAKFRISLTRHRNFTTLSNMPLMHSEFVDEAGEWEKDNFENSPIMSTYLVAFHIHKLDHRDIASDGRRVSVWASRRQLRWANITLDTAPKALDFFNDFTGIKDPMPKIDLVSVPRFQGALENWGVISFMPIALLYKPHGEGELRRVLNVKLVTHELAHTWFGNLVTPQWWDGLWLSEGAASFFSSLAMDEMEPEWDQLTVDTQDFLITTFYTNAAGTGRPLAHPVELTSDLHSVSYAPYYKGFSLFRMIYYSMGPSQFKQGIRRYLSNLQYNTTTPQLLFDAMNYSYQGQDLASLMDSWTYQNGLPVVFVNRSDSQLSLTQERFPVESNVEEGDEEEKRKEKQETGKWWVPVSYTTKSEKEFQDAQPKLWFNEDIAIPDPAKPEDWLLVNLQLAGTYHVRYDKANLQLLKNALNSSREEIPTLNRMQLVLDYGLFALSGLEPVPEVLELMEFLSEEKHFAPWAAGLRSLWRMDQRLRGTQAGDKLKERVRRLLSPQLSSLGLRTRKGDKMPVIHQRRQVVMHACLYKLTDCVRRAQRLFTKWTNQTDPDKVNPIPPDLRFTVYCTALRTGKEEYWNFLQERALQAKEPLHRDTMFSALGCFDKYEPHYRFMESKLDNSSVTRHDFTKLLQGLVQYNENIGPVLQFMEQSMVKMKSSTNKKLHWNQAMLRDLSQQIYEPEQLEQFKGLIAASKPWSKAEVAKVQRMVENNASWREKNKNIL